MGNLTQTATRKMRTMTSDNPWADIGASPGEFVGRRINDAHPLAVYWIKSNDGAPGLLVRGVHPDSVPRALPRPKGIAIQLSPAEDTKPWVRLILQNRENVDVFLALCRDVIDRSSGEANASAATTTFFQRLARWHALLSRGRPAEMGPQEIRGLIGELCLFESLAALVGPQAALASWVAPDDHPQDFALASSIVEVKTRLSGSRPHIQISSLEQLETLHLPLRLAVLELAPSDSNHSFSLNDIVARILAMFQPLGTALIEKAEVALASRGYIHKVAYDADRYVLAGSRAFNVGATFPRILRSAIDNRVRQATYVLDLTSLVEYEIDFSSVFSSAMPE